MIANPLLEEIWSVKDRLAREAGGDIHVFCQQLRDWSAQQTNMEPTVTNAAGLRSHLEKQENDALVLREEPSVYGEGGQ